MKRLMKMRWLERNQEDRSAFLAGFLALSGNIRLVLPPSFDESSFPEAVRRPVVQRYQINGRTVYRPMRFSSSESVSADSVHSLHQSQPDQQRDEHEQYRRDLDRAWKELAHSERYLRWMRRGQTCAFVLSLMTTVSALVCMKFGHSVVAGTLAAIPVLGVFLNEVRSLTRKRWHPDEPRTIQYAEDQS
jgi:hypothetical protein